MTYARTTGTGSRLLGEISRGALVIAGLVCSAAPALAQTAAPDAAQDAGSAQQQGEIVVTGFRGSIQTSLEAKRRSDVIIDEINAEDIADFPDSNLADSLQRLPGVSIDRDNGEGRTITVRGLGGDFNRTRINGLEALSTGGANDAGSSPNRSRSFDYNPSPRSCSARCASRRRRWRRPMRGRSARRSTW